MNTSTFLPFYHDPINECLTIIFQLILPAICTPQPPIWLFPKPRTTCFHLPHMIHKLDCPSRPIVCTCPTELIPSYFDSILSPLYPVPSHLYRDALHALPTSRTYNSLVPPPHLYHREHRYKGTGCHLYFGCALPLYLHAPSGKHLDLCFFLDVVSSKSYSVPLY